MSLSIAVDKGKSLTWATCQMQVHPLEEQCHLRESQNRLAWLEIHLTCSERHQISVLSPEPTSSQKKPITCWRVCEVWFVITRARHLSKFCNQPELWTSKGAVFKNTNVMAWGSQPVYCLFCEHDDLHSVPGTTYKQKPGIVAYTCSPSTGERDTHMDHWGHWPVRLAFLESFRLEKPYLKNRVFSYW